MMESACHPEDLVPVQLVLSRGSSPSAPGKVHVSYPFVQRQLAEALIELEGGVRLRSGWWACWFKPSPDIHVRWPRNALLADFPDFPDLGFAETPLSPPAPAP